MKKGKGMPAKRTRIKESKAPYRARRKTAAKAAPETVILRLTDVENAPAPIIIRHNDQPVAVVVKYDDYLRLEAARAERREAAWRELNDLLARVHARTAAFSTKDIEADITTARAEVRQAHARGRS
jgi:PHD/YefM family antitoxin component YafN of YafNO toxin-antitoxin module